MLERFLIFQPLTLIVVPECCDLKSGADLTIGATGIRWKALRHHLIVLASAPATHACQDVVIRQHECHEQDKPPAHLEFHVEAFFFFI